MVKKVLGLALVAVFVFSLSGCITTRRNVELANQELKDKVTTLEAQLSEKDNEINNLKESLGKSQGTNFAKTGARHERNTKQIQAALKNAGYYQGAIDGKMGKNTRQAIKDFQKANNLPADGKVGKKTWLVLKGYLDNKVK